MTFTVWHRPAPDVDWRQVVGGDTIDSAWRAALAVCESLRFNGWSVVLPAGVDPHQSDIKPLPACDVATLDDLLKTGGRGVPPQLRRRARLRAAWKVR